jgi:hypothetical protein
MKAHGPQGRLATPRCLGTPPAGWAAAAWCSPASPRCGRRRALRYRRHRSPAMSGLRGLNRVRSCALWNSAGQPVQPQEALRAGVQVLDLQMSAGSSRAWRLRRRERP